MIQDNYFIHNRAIARPDQASVALSTDSTFQTPLVLEQTLVELEHSKLALKLAIPEAEICVRLRAAVEEAASRSADSMEALRSAVCGFTAVLKDMGTTPEHVLIALKTVVNNRSLVVIAPHTSDWRGDHLRETISTWCIEEFFRDETASPSP